MNLSSFIFNFNFRGRRRAFVLSVLFWILLSETLCHLILLSGRATTKENIFSAWRQYHHAKNCSRRECDDKIWLIGDSTAPWQPSKSKEERKFMADFSSPGNMTVAGAYYICETLWNRGMRPTAIVILMRNTSWLATRPGLRPDYFFDHGFITPFATFSRIRDLAFIRADFALRMATRGLLPSLRLKSESARLLVTYGFSLSIPRSRVPESYIQKTYEAMESNATVIDFFQMVFLDRIIRKASSEGIPVYIGQTYYANDYLSKYGRSIRRLEEALDLTARNYPSTVYRINQDIPSYGSQSFGSDQIHLLNNTQSDDYRQKIYSELAAISKRLKKTDSPNKSWDPDA